MFIIRKVILLMILICSYNFVFADFVIRDGKMLSPVTDYNSNGFRKWWNLTDRCYETEYCAKHDVNLHARDAATRARTTAPVPATLNTSVPKKNVFQGLFSNARRGGRLLGAVGWLVMAYDLVNPWLVEGGWVWDPEKATWVRAIPQHNLTIVSYNSDYLPPSFDGPVTKNQLFYKCQIYNINCNILGSFPSSEVRYQLYNNYCPRINGNTADNLSSSGTCCFGNVCKSPPRFFIVNLRDVEVLSQDEFDRIIQPHADNDPSPYVNLSRPEQNAPVPGMSAPTVTVADGTVATTSPFTNPVTGQPQQIKFTFNTTNNVTNVRSVNINRPDLAPGSAEAPLPEGGPDDDTASEPAPGGGDQQQPDTPDLCDKYPNIMACDEQPEPMSEGDLTLPQKTVQIDFQPENRFPTDGQCPAPVTFQIDIMGASKTFAWEFTQACEVASRLRYLIIALAWVVAGFFCIRTVSSSV